MLLTSGDLTRQSRALARSLARESSRSSLTRTEFNLLELFMRNPRQVLTRSQIFERVWGYDFGASSNSLDVYIGYLRRKTEADGEALARDDIPSAKRHEMLDDVTTQLEELSALVTDVVDLARGEEAHSVRTDVRLDELVESVIDRMQRHAPELTFEATLDDSVAAVDPPRIERAVANLIDNAAKWSPAGGVVEVRLSEGMLSVRDQGPGISEDDLPFVFDRFYRSDKARTLPGSGLGLAIVRQVAEDHGGWVRVENAPDGGAIMRMFFGPQVSADFEQ